jgi:phage terminase large subunit-like protein
LVPYESWARRGLVEATPGQVIDYDFVLARVRACVEEYEVVDLAFDRWGSQQIINELQRTGFAVDVAEARRYRRPLLVQFGQGFASMSAPMKELEKLILSGGVGHGGNEVLTWMAGNLVATLDAAGNIKPDKARSSEKIDGLVALIMGLARAVADVETRGGSVYEGRGVRLL